VAVFRLPLPLYRRGWGGLLGPTFLLLVHAGRKTGKPHSTIAMVLRYDRRTHEAVICSAWGRDADWVHNIRVRPALQVQIGRESFTPQQRFLSEEESLAVVAGFPAPPPVEAASHYIGSGLGGSSFRYGRAGVRQHPAVRVFPSGRSLTSPARPCRW
jgi:deazaflavin-dependent oxidoreductase (nitroreductase family)